VVPYFEAAVDTLLDLLLKANIISNVKRTSRKNVEEGETENVTTARTNHRAAEKSLQDVKRKLEQKQGEAEIRPEKWGRQGEFKALDGTCIDKNMGEYTYEFCFFGRATQKPNRGRGDVTLGHFNRFEAKNTSITWQEDAFYLRAIHDAGQKCWNGPDRSLIVSRAGGIERRWKIGITDTALHTRQVDLSCGTENALLDVFEGEKCIYEAKVTTPAVCWPLQSSTSGAAAHQSAKEEL
jgi:protein kinase C substrate 80K-H